MENQSNDKLYTNRKENKECYTNGELIIFGIAFSLVIYVFIIIISLFFNNRCSVSEYFTPPENNVLGGMGRLPTSTLPPIEKPPAVIKSDNKQKEPFNNDLPNQTNKILTDGTNYSDMAADMALEQSVKDQHKQYIGQREKYTGTASWNPERSDSQDLVPYVGLRRPSYTTTNGDSLLDPTARQVPSVIDANQLAKPVNLTWNYGSFK